MSVTSPPRPPQPRASPRITEGWILEERPLRHPDHSSRQVMARRGWWLVGMNFLIPGSAQILAGSRKLGRFGLGSTLLLWVLVILTGLCALLWQPLLFTLATNWFVLLLAQALLIGYAALWAFLAVDTIRLVRLVKVGPAAKVGIAGLAVVLTVLASGTAAYGAQITGVVRDTLGSIFGASAASVPPSDGYYNILLLGADSGEGRDSMRYDSISVVSVNATSGAVTITGIPRDMVHAPFADGSPMQELYPDGFQGKSSSSCGWGSGINQLTNAVQNCRDDKGAGLYPDAETNGSTPAIEATKDAAEGMLGISIPYYVFIDMDGFASLVDALGGVDMNVTERLPEGGGPAYEGQPAEDWATGWIEVGQQHMDGDTAQWYARSRYTTSDWDRMKRQRELQTAILSQFTPTNVLTRFQDVAAAGRDLLQTDLPQSLLPFLSDLALKAKEQPVTTIELTPEHGVDPDRPDYAYVHEMVADSLHPATATPAPAG
ncbi:LCP family protein [Microbacterium sp. P01]|uniref:LCP family protein n=1 Tax=Microbacterium sp. P01 TaxID=3366261 RepID=UPI00366D878B